MSLLSVQSETLNLGKADNPCHLSVSSWRVLLSIQSLERAGIFHHFYLTLGALLIFCPFQCTNGS